MTRGVRRLCPRYSTGMLYSITDVHMLQYIHACYCYCCAPWVQVLDRGAVPVIVHVSVQCMIEPVQYLIVHRAQLLISIIVHPVQ